MILTGLELVELSSRTRPLYQYTWTVLKPLVSDVKHYVSNFVHCLGKKSSPSVKLKHFCREKYERDGLREMV